MVLGASPNPVRFSYKAVKSLMRHEQEVVAVGFREGLIEDQPILVGKPHIEGVHTVSIYIGSSRQTDYYEYVFSLKPQRVIFNPGTVVFLLFSGVYYLVGVVLLGIVLWKNPGVPLKVASLSIIMHAFLIILPEQFYVNLSSWLLLLLSSIILIRFAGSNPAHS